MKKITMVPNTASLTPEDESMLTLFLHSRQYMDKAKIHIALMLKDASPVAFVGSEEERTGPTLVYSDDEKFYIRIREMGSKKYTFEEIQPETANFLLKWMTFLGKVQVCRKIVVALSRIYVKTTSKNKKFEENMSMNHQFVALMEERITMKQTQNEFVKNQMWAEAANMRDSIKEQEEKIIQHLLRAYPKRKIFKSIYLKEILFEKRTDYCIPVLY